MAENIEMTQDQALDQLKLLLALKELDNVACSIFS